MSLYFIHIEIRSSDRYAALHEYLARLGAIQLTDTLWCARRARSGAVVINDAIKRRLKPMDMVCTIEAVGWSCFNTRATPAQAVARPDAGVP